LKSFTIHEKTPFEIPRQLAAPQKKGGEWPLTSSLRSTASAGVDSR